MAVRVENLNEVLKAFELLNDKVSGEWVIGFLTGIGEEMHNVELNTKTYKDVSGFLTSSIGYGVFAGGQLVKVGGFTGEGVAVGTALLQSMASDIGDRPAMVLVAAAPYASYVERNGFVVLDGARLNANGIVEHNITNLQL